MAYRPACRVGPYKTIHASEQDRPDIARRRIWWRRWLQWLTDSKRLVFIDEIWFKTFAGIRTSNWTSVRKLKEGEVTADLFGFLTTEPNDEVGAVHPKAMPVILTTPEECDA